MSTIRVARVQPQPLAYGELTQNWLRAAEPELDDETEIDEPSKLPLSAFITVAATAVLVVEVLAVVVLTW